MIDETHCYYLYILSNTNLGLYIGVTRSLRKRVWQHSQDAVEGFTKRYQMHRLVYYEIFEDIRNAIAREKRLKWWPRKWKLHLIQSKNPEWKDLAADWYEDGLEK